MKKCWRWFGKKDPITLDMLRQIGVEGIVTALHDVPNGQVCPTDMIREVKRYIASYGLHWAVVESLPVVESIKYGGKDRDKWIENFQRNLMHLGQAGVTTVCYNFMPVIDWVRTDLHKKLDDGTQTLYFDKIRYAYFDCKILKRKDAEKDYTPEELTKVNALDGTITEEEKKELIDTIIVKARDLSTEVSLTAMRIRLKLSENCWLYENVDETKLRENLKYFLQAVIPVAEKYGVRMCIHPDDPPFPYSVCRESSVTRHDIRWVLKPWKVLPMLSPSVPDP